MNKHELAVRLTQLEGKKKQVNIAQAKEIVKCLGTVFAELPFLEFVKLVHALRKQDEPTVTSRCSTGCCKKS